MSENNTINNLINALQKMPSIGARSAKRIALGMLQNKEKIIRPLMEALKEAYDNVNTCSICGNLTSSDICEICRDSSRLSTTICIVENVADLWAIESAKVYRGKYHILDGTLSAIEGRNAEVLKLEKLIERIKKDGVEEVLIATNPTLDGQTTALYIMDALQEFNLKISQPAFGVPMGSELSYMDDNTLNIAFRNKREC